MENVVYGHLEYFMAICQSCGILLCILFPRFGVYYLEKSGNPDKGEQRYLKTIQGPISQLVK
jgi:hypothetical protein